MSVTWPAVECRVTRLEMSKAKITAIQADITRLKVDVIVNAANSRLLGGGGVDGAIHSAAGPELLAFCRTLGGCSTGDAKITPGFNLPAKYVIHAVGPVWHGGNQNEPALLAGCYRKSLELAIATKLRSIAFPAISTGVYGYPIGAATKIAVATVTGFLRETSADLEVVFCCFSAGDLAIYQSELKNC